MYGAEIRSLFFAFLISHFMPHFRGATVKSLSGDFLVVQWRRLHAPKAGGPDLIPGQRTRSCMLKLRPGAAK